MPGAEATGRGGGRYPPTASAHVTVVTAKVAGVERVAACTRPIRGERDRCLRARLGGGYDDNEEGV